MEDHPWFGTVRVVQVFPSGDVMQSLEDKAQKIPNSGDHAIPFHALVDAAVLATHLLA